MSHPWSTPERSYLANVVGDRPWSIAVNDYRIWARRNGYPYRTELALRIKAEQRRISRRADGSYVTSGHIVDALGIGWPVIQRWIKKGWLKPHREGCKYYFHRNQIRRLVELAPEHFHGKDALDLQYLLIDEKLSEELSKKPRMWLSGTSKRVRCIEKRRIYESVKHAASVVYVTPPAIQKAIYTGGTSAGYHWEWA